MDYSIERSTKLMDEHPFGGEIYIDIEEPILFKNIKSVEFDFTR